MATWWTSDPHFKHKNVLNFESRPFKDIDEHDAKLVENYNKYVMEDDTLIFVGDISLDKKSRIRPILQQINCKNLILVQGNHDTKGALPKDCFKLIVNRMTVKMANELVVVSHFPPRWPLWKHLIGKLKGKKVRYRDRRPNDNGHFYIHGHTHGNIKQTGRAIHVGVDAWNYKPVSNDKLAQIIAQTVHREKESKWLRKIQKKYQGLSKRYRNYMRK